MSTSDHSPLSALPSLTSLHYVSSLHFVFIFFSRRPAFIESTQIEYPEMLRKPPLSSCKTEFPPAPPAKYWHDLWYSKTQTRLPHPPSKSHSCRSGVYRIPHCFSEDYKAVSPKTTKQWHDLWYSKTQTIPPCPPLSSPFLFNSLSLCPSIPLTGSFAADSSPPHRDWQTRSLPRWRPAPHRRRPLLDVV